MNGHVARELMREAAHQGARLVVFPEGHLSGYAKEHVRDWDDVDWALVHEELRRRVEVPGHGCPPHHGRDRFDDGSRSDDGRPTGRRWQDANGLGQSVSVTSWFTRQDLRRASAVERRVFEMVTDLLDHLQPARLHPTDQTIEIVDGETWMSLRHDQDPELEIRLVVCDGWVNFYGVMGHDEAYSDSSEAPDSWAHEAIDILADLLTATYTFETFKVRGQTWREVLWIGPPYDRVYNSGPTPAALLPLQRWADLTASRTSSFECRGSRPPGQPAL